MLVKRNRCEHTKFFDCRFEQLQLPEVVAS